MTIIENNCSNGYCTTSQEYYDNCGTSDCFDCSIFLARRQLWYQIFGSQINFFDLNKIYILSYFSIFIQNLFFTFSNCAIYMKQNTSMKNILQKKKHRKIR